MQGENEPQRKKSEEENVRHFLYKLSRASLLALAKSIYYHSYNLRLIVITLGSHSIMLKKGIGKNK